MCNNDPLQVVGILQFQRKAIGPTMRIQRPFSRYVRSFDPSLTKSFTDSWSLQCLHFPLLLLLLPLFLRYRWFLFLCLLVVRLISPLTKPNEIVGRGSVLREYVLAEILKGYPRMG